MQGEGKIDAPNETQRVSSSNYAGRSRGGQGRGVRKKAGKSRREQSRQEKLPTSSSFIGTITVAVRPEREDDAGEGGVESDRERDKSKDDDSAVLQALYDGAPLSAAFHHDLAEGACVPLAVMHSWYEMDMVISLSVRL